MYYVDSSSGSQTQRCNGGKRLRGLCRSRQQAETLEIVSTRSSTSLGICMVFGIEYQDLAVRLTVVFRYTLRLLGLFVLTSYQL